MGNLGGKLSRLREQQVQTEQSRHVQGPEKSLVWLERSGMVEGRVVENEAENRTCLVSPAMGCHWRALRGVFKGQRSGIR